MCGGSTIKQFYFNFIAVFWAALGRTYNDLKTYPKICCELGPWAIRFVESYRHCWWPKVQLSLPPQKQKKRQTHADIVARVE